MNSGAGNNWAHGFHGYGPQVWPRLQLQGRMSTSKPAQCANHEQCDSAIVHVLCKTLSDAMLVCVHIRVPLYVPFTPRMCMQVRDAAMDLVRREVRNCDGGCISYSASLFVTTSLLAHLGLDFGRTCISSDLGFFRVFRDLGREKTGLWTCSLAWHFTFRVIEPLSKARGRVLGAHGQISKKKKESIKSVAVSLVFGHLSTFSKRT